MVNKRSKKGNNTRENLEAPKMGQMEETKITKNINVNLENDDDSVTITQIDPKCKKGINAKTLATNHFNVKLDNEVNPETQKVNPDVTFIPEKFLLTSI